MSVDLKKKVRTAEEENLLLLQMWHQAQKGDSTAFCQLTEHIYKKLFNYAVNFSHDREFVKDIIQNLLVHIWEKKDRIEIQHVSFFFIRSLRNLMVSEYRKNNVLYSSIDNRDLGPLSDYRTIESDIEQMETSEEKGQRLKWAVEMLPKRQKEAVFLKYYEGMSNEQIADVMHLNRQSVANLLFKAILTLREKIPLYCLGLLSLASTF